MNSSLLQMANENNFVILQELLVQNEEDDDLEILETIKLVAQKHLSERWTDWKVLDLKKKDPSSDSKQAKYLPTHSDTSKIFRS